MNEGTRFCASVHSTPDSGHSGGGEFAFDCVAQQFRARDALAFGARVKHLDDGGLRLERDGCELLVAERRLADEDLALAVGVVAVFSLLCPLVELLVRYLYAVFRGECHGPAP